MTDTDTVTPAMLQELVRHYKGGSAPPINYAGDRFDTFRAAYQTPDPVTLYVPGLESRASVIGTDGSSSDAQGVGGYAAVRGDGWALAGSFSGPAMNSETCEAQAVRFALRLAADRSSVLLRLDPYRVIRVIQRLIEHRTITPSKVRDWDALNEILWHIEARGLNVSLQRIPDAEGDNNHDRIPSEPLMGAAHRLCWSIRKMCLAGIRPEGAALAWLTKIAASGIRWDAEMFQAWNVFLRNHR